MIDAPIVPGPPIFGPEQLAAVVREQLGTVPPGRTSALVGAVDARGVQLVAQFKFQDARWQVVAVARHDWSGDNVVQARVMLSW